MSSYILEIDDISLCMHTDPNSICKKDKANTMQ